MEFLAFKPAVYDVSELMMWNIQLKNIILLLYQFWIKKESMIFFVVIFKQHQNILYWPYSYLYRLSYHQHSLSNKSSYASIDFRHLYILYMNLKKNDVGTCWTVINYIFVYIRRSSIRNEEFFTSNRCVTIPKYTFIFMRLMKIIH